MSDSDIIIDVDSTAADRTIENVKAQSDAALRAMVTNIRRAAQIGIYTAQAMGFAIDQSITLSIEAALLTVELAVQVGTLSSLTAIGALKAGLMVLQIILIMQTVAQLRTNQTEAATTTGATVQALRLLLY
ncbi:hypothetical protein LCGC14_1257410 [marine sediment metagenome]|uniref:Uncharacterized protein n=1 Tax=marine sediment metagenome TaxID=412755 RepID=A0A0F9L4G8_9ZZZZ